MMKWAADLLTDDRPIVPQVDGAAIDATIHNTGAESHPHYYYYYICIINIWYFPFIVGFVMLNAARPCCRWQWGSIALSCLSS